MRNSGKKRDSGTNFFRSEPAESSDSVSKDSFEEFEEQSQEPIGIQAEIGKWIHEFNNQAYIAKKALEQAPKEDIPYLLDIIDKRFKNLYAQLELLKEKRPTHEVIRPTRSFSI